MISSLLFRTLEDEPLNEAKIRGCPISNVVQLCRPKTNISFRNIRRYRLMAMINRAEIKTNRIWSIRTRRMNMNGEKWITLEWE